MDGLNTWKDASLGCVVTLGEARKFWGKSRTAIFNQIVRGNLEARKTITGGSYLISVKSMIRVYGKPKDARLWSMRITE